MDWKTRFPIDRQPTIEEISAAVDNPLWDELLTHLEGTYHTAPKVEYSKCSMAPGWNVKYKKGSKAICTLYPQEGSYQCMVVIGEKQNAEAELLLPALDPAVQQLYRGTKSAMGGRWLMVPVTAPAVLDSLLQLIALRMR